MSELAFNSTGENFDIPAVVTGWRVRRLKPRGAPELVYGRDGRPLTIPIESEMSDLREAVAGVLGRYRLDPTNDDGKAVEGTPAAYIQVVKAEQPVDAHANTVVRYEDDVALSANVAETPASPKFNVEGDRGMHDDKSDGEADRGVDEGTSASVHDGREDPDPARGRRGCARDRWGDRAAAA